MSIPVVAFFNNKGGVGKTSLVYHLAWMFAERGHRVLAADLDPQCNLTAAFVDEDRLEEIMIGNQPSLSIYGAISPLKAGTGDIAIPHIEALDEKLALVLGDMALSIFEDDLSEVWPKCLSPNEERAFRVTSAFWRVMQEGAKRHEADLILVDLGPNLGAINRAALIAADYVVIPLGPDLFSLQGLRNLGPVLESWRVGWRKRLDERPKDFIDLPEARIQPIGYIIMRHSVRFDRPVKAYDRWIARIPSTYAEYVLQEEAGTALAVDADPNCIATLKDYRSLMPLAQEARKPMFFLKPADGALGAHTSAVTGAYKDFRALTEQIADRINLPARV